MLGLNQINDASQSSLDFSDRMRGKSEIRNLESGLIGKKRFGAKAASLANANQIGLNIGKGFALATGIIAEICKPTPNSAILQALEEIFTQLIQLSPIRMVIVRSSHFDEDGTNLRVSGYYQSVPNCRDFGSFLDAIKTSAKSSNEGEYHFIPVILQPQLHCDFSAILLVSDDSFSIELFEGNLAGPIAGNGMPTVVCGRFNISNRPLVEHLEVRHDGQQIGERAALNLARSAISTIVAASRDCLFELGYSNREWTVFQFQEGVGTVIKAYKEDFVEFQSMPKLVDAERIGVKAAAMNYFKAQNLFQKRLQVFASQNVTDSNLEELFDSWSFPATIRFSNGTKLGLPRFLSLIHI